MGRGGQGEARRMLLSEPQKKISPEAIIQSDMPGVRLSTRQIGHDKAFGLGGEIDSYGLMKRHLRAHLMAWQE